MGQFALELSITAHGASLVLSPKGGAQSQTLRCTEAYACELREFAECVCRESDTMFGGPGLVWSCVERENNSLFAIVREKYRSTESLFHLPIFMISSREMPALSAELAAPRRKEWPLNPAGFIPSKSSACLSLRRTHFRSNGPSNRENSGAVAGRG